MSNRNREARNGRGTGLGAKMAGGNPDVERGREEDDYYPTPVEVTQALVIEYPHLKGQLVWEPCAGDGAMAAALLDGGVGRVACSDINPRVPIRSELRIGRADVFSFTKMPKVDAVITNPPFMLAPKMIHHILSLEGGPPPFLALVLKATFWHAAKRHRLFQQHRPTAIHPLLWRPDFLQKGAPTMEIMWCVWDQAEADVEPIYAPLPHPAAK